jgi:hypothetical protein
MSFKEAASLRAFGILLSNTTSLTLADVCDMLGFTVWLILGNSRAAAEAAC